MLALPRLEVAQWARQMARPSGRSLAVLAMLLATAMWGTSFVANESVLARVPPVTLALLRSIVSLGLLLPPLYLTGRRPSFGCRSAMLGLVGVALVFLFQNLGQQHTGPANAALIMNGGLPVMATLLAIFVLGERLGLRGLSAAGLSLAGVAAVVIGGSGGVLDLSLAGNLLMLLAALAGATHGVLGKRAFVGLGVLPVLAGSTVYGALVLLPMAAIEWVAGSGPAPTIGDGMLLVYLGAGCSGLTYLLWGFSLRHLTVSQTAVIGNVELVVGVAVAAAIANDGLAAPQFAGGALILAGALVAARAS